MSFQASRTEVTGRRSKARERASILAVFFVHPGSCYRGPRGFLEFCPLESTARKPPKHNQEKPLGPG